MLICEFLVPGELFREILQFPEMRRLHLCQECHQETPHGDAVADNCLSSQAPSAIRSREEACCNRHTGQDVADDGDFHRFGKGAEKVRYVQQGSDNEKQDHYSTDNSLGRQSKGPLRCPRRDGQEISPNRSHRADTSEPRMTGQ